MAGDVANLVVRLAFDSGDAKGEIDALVRKVGGLEQDFRQVAAATGGFGGGLAGLGAKAGALRQQLEAQKQLVAGYGKAIEQSNAKVEAAKGKQEEYRQRLEAARQAVEQNKAALKEAEAAHKASTKATGENSEQTIELGLAVLELKDKQEALDKELVKAQGQYDAQGKNIGKAEKATRKLSDAQREAQIRQAELEASIRATNRAYWEQVERTGQAQSALGGKLTMGVTVPIVGAGGYAIQQAVSFESAFAGVKKTVDGTDAQLAQLRQGIIDLSHEIPSTAEEISAVAEAAGQLGIQTENIMGFTRAMMDLKETTNLGDEGASQLAKFANITQMSQDNFDRLGSTIVDLGNNMATTEADIVAMGMRLAGAGKQVGMTEAEIMGMAAALSSVGIEAEAGGSAFSKLMVDMQLAVETNSEGLKDYAKIAGMTAEQFAAAFKGDAAGAMRDFIAGLASGGDSAIKVLDDIGISEVRMRDALLRSSGAGELFGKSIQMASSAWKQNTALTKEASQRYQTFESRLKMAGNQAKSVARSFGEDLMPYMESALDYVTGLTEQFDALGESGRKTAMDLALGAAAIGPGIKLIGAANTSIGKMGKALGSAQEAAIAAGGGLKGFLSGIKGLLGPAGIAAAVVALGVGAYKLYDWASGAKAAREATEGMIETAKRWQETQTQSVYDKGGLDAFGMSKEAFTGVQSAAQWMEQLVAVWSDGRKETDEIVSGFVDSWGALTDGTQQALKGLHQTAVEAGQMELAGSIQDDMDRLDSIDGEIEKLLKKRQSKKLTEKDQLKLQSLIEEKEEIEVKYKLTPEDTGGYEQIGQKLQKELAKAQARGEAGLAPELYGQALTAAAEGHAAVRQEIEAQYDEEYALIQLMEDEEQRTQALEELNGRYNESRLQAAREYAQAVREFIGPAWEGEGMTETKQYLDELQGVLGKFDGTRSPESLEDLQQTLDKMNKDDLVSYVGMLTQVQSLMDSGMSEQEVQELFPEIDVSGSMDQLAALADYVKKYPEELEGLDEILNGIIPQEMQRIAIDLDMTEAQRRWTEFAENPGEITTEAIIGGASMDPKVPVPQVVVDGLVQSYREIEGGASTEALTPDEVVAEVSAYLEANDCDLSRLTPDQIEGIVNAYVEATGCDKSKLLEAFTVKITAYDDTGVPRPSTTVALVGYELTEFNKFMEQNPVEVKGVLRLGDVYENPQDVLNGDNVHYYMGGVEIPANIVPAEKIDNNTLFVLEDDGAMHVLIVPDFTGTPEGVEGAMQQLNTPEVNPKAIWSGDYTALDPLKKIINASKELKEAQESGDWLNLFSINGFGGDGYIQQLENLSDRIDPKALGDISVAVGELLTAAQNGEKIDPSSLASVTDVLIPALQILEEQDVSNALPLINTIAALMERLNVPVDANNVAESLAVALEPLKTVGDQGAEGVGQGMAEHDFTGDANTMAGHAVDASNAAFAINSPSRLMIPVGAGVGEGVGQGMTQYSFAADALAMAGHAQSATAAAFAGLSGDGRSYGRLFGLGLDSGLASTRAQLMATARSIANEVKRTIKEAWDIHSPSREGEWLGDMMVRGIDLGMQKRVPDVIGTLQGLAPARAAAAVAPSITNNNQRSSNVQVTIDRASLTSDQAVDDLAREIARYNRRILAGYGG